MVAALVVLAHLAAAAAAGAQDQSKQILVLYSTRPDAQLSIVGERELPRVLEAGLGQSVNYYSEFLDVATFPARAHAARLRRRSTSGSTSVSQSWRTPVRCCRCR